MFEKDLHLSYLLDFYGEVLQEKIQRVMDAYYNDDLSLAEIALGEEISRQGVRHLIKRGEEQLREFEDKLGLASHYTQLKIASERLEDAAKNLLDSSDPGTATLAQEALSCAHLMRNQ